jgi:hypothetical protein
LHRRTLGYDIRLRPSGISAPDWTGKRRERYLLRPEIPWPFSVDRNVWEALFSYREQEGLDDRWPTLAVKPAEFPHQVLELWQDLAAMEGCGQRLLLESGAEIRVDLLTVTPWQDFESWSFLADFQEPKTERDDLWQSLGFDIADEGFTSGLTNCGYGEERFEWRARWASLLNEHGLPERIGDAFALCAEMDKRVEEHAPFFVFELHQLRSVGQFQ